jgi:tRNA dimethylallyltransferase
MAGSDDGPSPDSGLVAPRVLSLVGPTASGKTTLVTHLAQEFPLEVVCMDAMQLYGELAVGTAIPAEDERKVAPHHLFGDFSVRSPLSAEQWAEIARIRIQEIHQRGRVPLLVGGSGLYARTLFDGISAVPATPAPLRESLLRRVERRGLLACYRLLQRLDPEGAARLHPNDRQRILRFLEVTLLSGRSMLSFWAEGMQGALPHPCLHLGLQLDKEQLESRISARLTSMLSQGWLPEAAFLLKSNLAFDVMSLGPIGYRWVFSHLRGEMEFSEMEERIHISTRQYAKRQMTWFKKDKRIVWFNRDPQVGYNVEAVVRRIREFVSHSA